MDNKKALILGGGSSIGLELAKKLKKEGCFVRIADIKEKSDAYNEEGVCDEYLQVDLRNPSFAMLVMNAPGQESLDDSDNAFDEVYCIARDKGKDLNSFSNSIRIDINACNAISNFKAKNVYALMYPGQKTVSKKMYSLLGSENNSNVVTVDKKEGLFI